MGARTRIKGLAKLLPEWTWNYTKRRPITTYNPTREAAARPVAADRVYTIFRYGA
ncbi:MAG: hypothetical protein K0R82_335, partial [Flavipsychrobacter sp.]|nr:hypothetical protein [Flavipsychrobacter sp.]